MADKKKSGAKKKTVAPDVEEKKKADTPGEEAEVETEEKAADIAEETAEGETSEEAKADESADGTSDSKKKKDKKDEKIEELTDRLTRQMAEFDNFRKRTEKEKAQMFETGAKSIVEKVLPVVDSFERALAGVPDEEKENPFVDGMDKVLKQMMTMLHEAGVTPIEAVGKEFDPELHNAVMHVDDDSFGENEIVEEFQKGYKYRESVVRHSMVKVAN